MGQAPSTPKTSPFRLPPQRGGAGSPARRSSRIRPVSATHIAHGRESMGKQFAILRTEKIGNWSSLTKSVGHNLRSSADDRTHIDPTKKNRILIGEADWLTQWKADVAGMHLRKLQQGKSHTLAREFFLGMSPEWAEGKSKKQIAEWAEANVEWLKERFGEHRVKFAVLHLDEQTPHVAAYVVGLKEDPKQRGNGWTLSDASLGLNGHRDALVKLQDDYAAAMKRFDLARGLKGSKRTHQKTSEWAKQMATPLDAAITRPKTPEPTTADRQDPKSYANAAAQAAAMQVFKQMKPYRDQAREQTKELTRLRAAVERLEPIAEIFQRLIEALLGKPVKLDTLEGMQSAMDAVSDLEAKRRPSALKSEMGGGAVATATGEGEALHGDRGQSPRQGAASRRRAGGLQR